MSGNILGPTYRPTLSSLTSETRAIGVSTQNGLRVGFPEAPALPAGGRTADGPPEGPEGLVITSLLGHDPHNAADASYPQVTLHPSNQTDHPFPLPLSRDPRRPGRRAPQRLLARSSSYK